MAECDIQIQAALRPSEEDARRHEEEEEEAHAKSSLLNAIHEYQPGKVTPEEARRLEHARRMKYEKMTLEEQVAHNRDMAWKRWL